MSNSEQKSFLLYLDALDILDDLDDKDAGKLFKAIKTYKKGGEVELSQMLKIAFTPIKNHLDRDEKKYLRIVERNRVNGRKGGRPKGSGVTQSNPENPVGYLETQRNPEEPKKADSDNDNDSDNDKKNKEQATIFFEEFWNLYPKKTGKKKCKEKYLKLASQHERIMKGLQNYIDDHNKKTRSGEFTPSYKNPMTFLNGEHWNDEFDVKMSALDAYDWKLDEKGRQYIIDEVGDRVYRG